MRQSARRPVLEAVVLRFPSVAQRLMGAVLGLDRGSRLRRPLVSLLMRQALGWSNRQDLDAILVLCEPDVVLGVHGFAAGTGLAESYHGHDGMRQYTEDWQLGLGWPQMTIQELIDLGDRLVALVHLDSAGATSGIALTSEPGAVVSFSARGLLARLDLHWEWDDALAAAGLDPGQARPGSEISL
jgi:hypothetical protein